VLCDAIDRGRKHIVEPEAVSQLVGDFLSYRATESVGVMRAGRSAVGDQVLAEDKGQLVSVVADIHPGRLALPVQRKNVRATCNHDDRVAGLRAGERPLVLGHVDADREVYLVRGKDRSNLGQNSLLG